MIVLEQTFLLMFALMGLGLLLCFSPLFNDPEIVAPNGFWLLSVGLFSGSCLIFSGIPWSHPALLTLANFCVISSFAWTAILFRSWQAPIGRSLLVAVWLLLALSALAFEVIRQYGTYSDRVVFITVALETFLIWQAYELVRSIRSNGHLFLKYIGLLVALNFLLILARTILTLHADVVPTGTIFSEAVLSRLLRWSAQGSVLLTFFLIGAYFLQKQMQVQRKMIDALRSKDSMLSAQNIENSAAQRLLAERDKLVESLISVRKTAETGALSAALAHELNQPLCAIQLNGECLKMELSSQHPNPAIEQELISRILSDNKRASDIILALRRIFFQTAIVPQRTELGAFIQSLEILLSPLTTRQGISLSIKWDPAAPVYVEIELVEFQQVIFNLVTNAIEALTQTDTSDKSIEIEVTKSDQKAQVAILDNGTGFQANQLSNIFNLLSSHKPTGMGLGLWLTHHIVERHKGTTRIETRPGWSTAFIIELPLSQ